MNLCNLMITKELISIYDNDELDAFRVGYITALSDEYVILRMITTKGYEDGLYLTKIDDIYKVECQDKYLIKIKKLIKYNNEEINYVDFKSDNLVLELINYSMKNKFVISIMLSNDDKITGIVDNVEENAIKLINVNEFGEENGFTFININLFIRIWCNSSEERLVKFMYDLKD